MKTRLGMAAVALGATVMLTAAPAQARWGHGWGWGAGAAGFAAGALIGGAVVGSRPYYGPGYYAYGPGYPAPAYGPGYGYEDDGYVASSGYADDGYGPEYAQGPDEEYAQGPAPGGNAQSYCASRFRSYDPRSGTYLGFDGVRHSCP